MFIQGLNSAEVHDSAQFALGTRGVDHLGREYVYVEADANIAAKAFATIAADHGAQALDTDEAATILVGSQVGIAVVAVASGKFGWLARYGHGFTGLCADATAGVRLKATSTAGTVDDDAAVEAGIVKGAALEVDVTGGDGEGSFTLNYPFVDTDLDTQ